MELVLLGDPVTVHASIEVWISFKQLYLAGWRTGILKPLNARRIKIDHNGANDPFASVVKSADETLEVPKGWRDMQELIDVDDECPLIVTVMVGDLAPP